MESEEIFRDNYYKGVIDELSPSYRRSSRTRTLEIW